LRSFARPVENIIVLGIAFGGMLLFMVVAGWLTWESVKQRKLEREGD
jgi:hypothetical protein|tara:strand:- start:1907 stop:2047 length:141 start_codon:yes stop_codon:yes gene_type:complete